MTNQEAERCAYCGSEIVDFKTAICWDDIVWCNESCNENDNAETLEILRDREPQMLWGGHAY